MLEDLTSDILFGSQHPNLSIFSGIDRSGVGSEEFGSAGNDFTIFDAEIEAQVMPFESPSPQSGFGGFAKNTEVILAGIAALATCCSLTGFNQVKDFFKTHHV